MTLKLPILKTWQGTFSRWASELKSAALLRVIDFFFESFEPNPTGTGSMTVTAPIVEVAKYIKIGQLVLFIARFSCTTGGVAANEILIDVPVPPADSPPQDGVFFCWVVDGGAEIAGVGRFEPSTTKIGIRRYDAANFSLGTARYGAVAGFYQCNP